MVQDTGNTSGGYTDLVLRVVANNSNVTFRAGHSTSGVDLTNNSYTINITKPASDVTFTVSLVRYSNTAAQNLATNRRAESGVIEERRNTAISANLAGFFGVEFGNNKSNSGGSITLPSSVTNSYISFTLDRNNSSTEADFGNNNVLSYTNSSYAVNGRWAVLTKVNDSTPSRSSFS